MLSDAAVSAVRAAAPVAATSCRCAPCAPSARRPRLCDSKRRGNEPSSVWRSSARACACMPPVPESFSEPTAADSSCARLQTSKSSPYGSMSPTTSNMAFESSQHSSLSETATVVFVTLHARK